MAEPMVLDTLKLASTAGLGGWLATLQRTSATVCAANCRFCYTGHGLNHGMGSGNLAPAAMFNARGPASTR